MARGTILSYPSTLQLNNEQEAHASALQRGLIRTMDGGFIDNSSVAYGLSTLQNDQGLNDNFKISSFISKAESPMKAGAMCSSTTVNQQAALRCHYALWHWLRW